MKNLTPFRLLSITALLFLTASITEAATFLWNGSSAPDLNWATAANWTPAGPPGTADTAVFNETATVSDMFTVNNRVGVSTNITGLQFTNVVSGAWHVTEIPSGNVLTVSGPVSVGNLTGTGAPILVTDAAMFGGGTFIATGTPFKFFNLAVALNKKVTMTNASINIDSGSNVITGPITIDSTCTIDVDPSQALNILGTLSGPGSLTKIEAGTLLLSGAVSYTGDTAVDVGTLSLVGASSLASSPNISIAGGATLDVSARSDSTLTLGSARTLSGNGTVRGTLQANASSTVSPGGNSAVGRLTVTNAALLAGTIVMEVDKANFTNDLLNAASMTYGGTLNVSTLGDPFGAGNSFKLFSAGAYNGSFTAINPPTPGAGLAWDTTGLTNGVLKVVSTSPVSRPDIVTFGSTPTDVTLGGTGGPAYGTYYLLTSTNVALPGASWTSLATNYFDASGNFSVTVPVDLLEPRRFYMLLLP